MQESLKQYLFGKHILVSEGRKKAKDPLYTLLGLHSLFHIRIREGGELATPELIRFASSQLGQNVPEPFYRGFPQSVRDLSPDVRLLDQLFHYAVTYGLGYFSQAGHSLFEKAVRRTPFAERTEEKTFSILTEEEAAAQLQSYAEDLLASTRPLSEEQYALVLTFLLDYHPAIAFCASKNTAIRLLLDTRDLAYSRFLSMSDVIKLVEELNYRDYGRDNIRKLNLNNQDRKFITALIDSLLTSSQCDIPTCYEKKALWAGLLHHIHYQPEHELGQEFAACMRGKGNQSAYAAFEKAMAVRDIRSAVAALKSGKGSGAVLRNLNYIVSRCRTEEEVQLVVEQMGSGNTLILIQLLIQYALYPEKKDRRFFKITRFNQLTVHRETEEEADARKSYLSPGQVEQLSSAIRQKLEKKLKNRLGKVYIDPAMERIALPLQEATSQGGYGVLPRGTRLPIEEGKKLRGFTYWEKVNDIDLSVIAIREDGRQEEFSWRTMYSRQSPCITYSGDQTSGYQGGSEYFDVDLEAFREEYPEAEYLVFCNNVFSGTPFNRCVCRAGFMLRDIRESGEIFEPKTVQSSFTINCDSTFAYLFAIDLKEREFVWLNVARESSEIVAGKTDLGFLTEYFHTTSVISVGSFFKMMASQVVEDPMEADVILSDQALPRLPKGAEVIRSYDTERILALMNQ